MFALDVLTLFYHSVPVSFKCQFIPRFEGALEKIVQ